MTKHFKSSTVFMTPNTTFRGLHKSTEMNEIWL